MIRILMRMLMTWLFWLTVAAGVVAYFVWAVKHSGALQLCQLFFILEGTVLLACAITVPELTIKKALEKHTSTRSFNLIYFWSGLLLIAASAVIGALQ